MTDSSNIVDVIREDRDNLSHAFRRIADFIAAEPRQFIHSPLRVLSEKIGVSEPTIIRFARHYAFQGLPDLRLALAMSVATRDMARSADLEPRLADKEVVNRRAKRAIAARAAELMVEDTSLLLDSGSTLQLLAESLLTMPGKTILTTSLGIVGLLRGAEQHRLLVPGGTVRSRAGSIGGRMAEENLGDMTFDTVYLGADTVHPKYGLSTYNEEEAHLNRAMIHAGRRVVVLVDATKFRGPALHHICDLSEVDIIVSDSSLPTDIRAAIEASSTQLILADDGAAHPAIEDKA